jgi:hypothetical protein
MFRVRREKCPTCLYRLHYDRGTRERVLGDAAAMDGYVGCHYHENVCCRGYYDAVGENGCTAVQLAIRFERMGFPVELVDDGQYPKEDDDDDWDV